MTAWAVALAFLRFAVASDVGSVVLTSACVISALLGLTVGFAIRGRASAITGAAVGVILFSCVPLALILLALLLSLVDLLFSVR